MSYPMAKEDKIFYVCLTFEVRNYKWFMYSISPYWMSVLFEVPNYSQKIKQKWRGPFPSSWGIYDLKRLLMSSC